VTQEKPKSTDKSVCATEETGKRNPSERRPLVTASGRFKAKKNLRPEGLSYREMEG